MKTTLLSIIGMLLMGELMAGHTKVTFFSERGESFILIVNGQRVNHRPATRVYLDNLYAGRNDVRVRIHGRRGQAVIARPVFIDDGFATEFAISASPRHGYRLEKVAAYPKNDRRGHHGNSRVKEREYHYEGDNYSKPNRGYKGHHGRGHRIRHVNMDNVLSSLDYYHFDREKLRFAKDAIANRVILSHEVARIMRAFTFEEAKIKFATYAYQFTVNPENFHKVKRAFTFRSSARELDKRLHY